MSSPSNSPNPSPAQSPSQSRSNHTNQQPYASPGGSAPSPSPTRGSSRAPSHPATPNASQPSSRASSLAPSPHVQPRGSSQNATPPASKSPSQSGLKSLSRNSSQTPPIPGAKSPAHSPAPSASYIGLGLGLGPIRGIPSYIAPYVPRFMKEAPFFQPPTSPLPQNQCFPCSFPCRARDRPRKPPDSLYFPLLPPPPHPRWGEAYQTGAQTRRPRRKGTEPFSLASSMLGDAFQQSPISPALPCTGLVTSQLSLLPGSCVHCSSHWDAAVPWGLLPPGCPRPSAVRLCVGICRHLPCSVEDKGDPALSCMVPSYPAVTRSTCIKAWPRE